MKNLKCRLCVAALALSLFGSMSVIDAFATPVSTNNVFDKNYESYDKAGKKGIIKKLKSEKKAIKENFKDGKFQKTLGKIIGFEYQALINTLNKKSVEKEKEKVEKAVAKIEEMKRKTEEATLNSKKNKDPYGINNYGTTGLQTFRKQVEALKKYYNIGVANSHEKQTALETLLKNVEKKAAVQLNNDQTTQPKQSNATGKSGQNTGLILNY